MRRKKHMAALLICLLLAAALIPMQARAWPGTDAFISEPLSLAEAVNIALRQNPAVRRAETDVEAAQGVSIQTRAIAIPKVGITGDYSAVQDSDIDRPPGLAFSFGSDQSWRTQIKLVQSIYEGGRVVSSLRTARLLRQQAMMNYQTALADTVLAVQVAYFDVLLAEQQITVRERSIELLSSELADTKRRYEAGTIPRFNVLRAEVELANERPNLSRARNAFRTGKNNLANLLGFTIPEGAIEDIPLVLSDKLTAEPFQIDLSRAIKQGLSRRSELESLRTARALSTEQLTSAKAGYKPSLQGFAGYDVHSSMFSDNLTEEFHGWIAGAQLTWNIFDGLQTQGRVKEARARLDRAEVDLEDTMQRIELEIRTAHSSFIEAKEVLESTGKVVEEAEESLRLATARNQAGTGTQLDVLSARTALTQAQTTQNVALRDYSVARARLERAVGANLPEQGAR
jgi:outer membrane protein TolC